MRPPIHSTKHYIQKTLTTVATGTRDLTNVCIAVATVDKNVATEVEEGATVKACYVELWAIGSSSNQFFTATFEKVVSGLTGPTVSQMADLFSYPNKKNILYTTQGLASNDGIAMPLPLYKGWIKIPKSKQRFGLGDRLVMAVSSRGSADIIICGFYTYKEYT